MGRLVKATMSLALALACAEDPHAVPPQRFQSPPHAPVALFTNGGFEFGNLNNWAVTTNLNQGITHPPANVNDLNLKPGGNADTLTRTGTTQQTLSSRLRAAPT